MMRSLKPAFLTVSIAVVIALIPQESSAHFVMPTDAPVDRLVKNLESYIAEHPDEAQAYYSLARVHSLAYALKSRSLRAFEGMPIPHPADEEQQKYPRRPTPGDKPSKKQDASQANELTTSELQRHAREAVRNYNKAIELDRRRGLYFLSLASFLESAVGQSSECWWAPLNIPADIDEKAKEAGARLALSIARGEVETQQAERIIAMNRWDWSAQSYRALIAGLQEVQFIQAKGPRSEIHRLLDLHWSQATKDCYFQAFELEFVADSRRKTLPMDGLKELISHEAAVGFLRVTSATAQQSKEQDRRAEVSAGLEALRKIPRSFLITPIVFSMSPSRSVRDLVSPGHRSVAFDLDGTGRPQKWNWVKADTGILVWDPSGSGRITSGRQLFGSVTWWIFWENGYAALDALDDNRDGELSGDELVGLAVWFDRNSNGVSDAGEVRSLASLGITTIACRVTTESDGVPANPRGVTLADGNELPTYDWIASQAEDPGPGSLTYAFVAAFSVIGLWMHKNWQVGRTLTRRASEGSTLPER
jgi:hypothetical protein